MDRRYFLKNTAAATSLLPFINLLQACESNKKKQKVMVLVQLIGGNDGLNTLIPLDNYKNIVQARPNLYIPENKILPINGFANVGLHPSFKGVLDLINSGNAAFVQGVGYENQSYSHFRSSDIWLTGSSASKVLYTGWMARYLEKKYQGYPKGFPSLSFPNPPAIKVGNTGTFAFQGELMDMSIVLNPSAKPSNSGTNNDTSEPQTFADLGVKSIREIYLQSDKYTNVLKNALNASFQQSTLYPKEGENPLADKLKVVARLINSGLQTPVYLVDLRGFDTHAEQVLSSDPTKGVHADLLFKISQALCAFWDDINHMNREDEVAGMVFSEFGRRIKSNDSFGTDHGAAQPLLFFGPQFNKAIIGNNPTIPNKVTVDDNLEMQFDFRNVFSSLLSEWFDAPSSETASVFGQDFSNIGIFK